jgi:serine/threonine protein kinase
MLQMQKVVAGLEHMHAHGLIHRDIKVQKWKDFMRHQMHRFKKTPRRDLFDHIYD